MSYCCCCKALATANMRIQASLYSVWALMKFMELVLSINQHDRLEAIWEKSL